MALSQSEKAENFRALHEGEPFLIPNPWDAGSAKMLAGLGYKALATTSSGFAFTRGKPDGAATLDEVAAHVELLSQATDLPLSVDLENGYGPAPADAAVAVTRVGEAGAVGGSIEDLDRDDGKIYELEHAAERIATAAGAARAFDFHFTLTARAENFLGENPDLDDTIARLRAYEQAGADVLYAPGLRKVEDVRAICEAVDKPVNVLGSPRLGMTIEEIFEAGAQRISVGGGLTWAAVDAAIEVAERMQDGDLSGLSTPGRVREWLAG